MKFALTLLIAFGGTLAHAGDGAPAQELFDSQLKKIATLQVFSLKLPVHLVHRPPELPPTKTQPQSCDVKFEKGRQKMEVSCDAMKTFKIETIKIAAIEPAH